MTGKAPSTGSLGRPTDPVCAVDHRRQDVRDRDLNGLDYVEVEADLVTLCVHFLGEVPHGLKPENFRISGGRRVRDLRVLRLGSGRSEVDGDACVEVVLDRPGDSSKYSLCIIDAQDADGVAESSRGVYPGIDPRYACADVDFTVDCLNELDCQDDRHCEPALGPEPAIDYLARDYTGFRGLMLDRLALLMPDWTERHVPDLGITLVELLAYVADYLAYYQDAVATEAYLSTARQRISVRRHARLVDYFLHEGTNARAWVFVEIEDSTARDPSGAAPAQLEVAPGNAIFLTGWRGAPAIGRVLDWRVLPESFRAGYECFEPLVADAKSPLRFLAAHNTIEIYSWGDRECCLPRGATEATLVDGPPGQQCSPPGEPPKGGYGGPAPKDTYRTPPPKEGYEPPPAEGSYGAPPAPPLKRALDLRVGDYLLFEEVLGPRTGSAADADPAHRHVVRLTEVTAGCDPLYGQPVLEVAWDRADALPFPLCLSSIGPAPDCRLLTNVSVARGNIVLCDHGCSRSEELPVVPEPDQPLECEAECVPAEVFPVARPYHPPPLRHGPVVFRQTLPRAATPASAVIDQDPHLAVPNVRLVGHLADHHGGRSSQDWESRPDLLGSQSDDPHFVVEMDDRRRAHLRFGDGALGRAPEPATEFEALYRVGGGVSGNVGAGSIAYLALRDGSAPDGVRLLPRNPLPGRGGIEPQSVVDAKLFAPYAFRAVLERAVVADDYAALATTIAPAREQRAAASLSWTGSWYEADVAVHELGTAEPEPDLIELVSRGMERYRRMGHDLRVGAGQAVALYVELTVCVLPHFLKAHVAAALLDRFSNRVLPGGRRGFFHPDNLGFGEGVHVSQLVAAAQAVEGVDSVEVSALRRLFGPNGGAPVPDALSIGPLEVARLDNDPANPDNGRLVLAMTGGR